MTESFDDPVLREWHDTAQQEAKAHFWYARVQEMRKMADYYERSLLRHLYFERGLSWSQIAEIVNANLGSRQAAQQKWRRLIADERRQPGGPGVWPRGHRRVQ